MSQCVQFRATALYTQTTMPRAFHIQAIAAVTLAVSGWATSLPCLADALTVSAASSLTNAFKEIGQAYERQNPQTQVLLNFGASGALLQQISRGAPVDVLAAADQDTMDQAQQQGWVQGSQRRQFAGNRLVVIQPIDRPYALRSLQDLLPARVEKIAVGHPASVPVGRYAQQALEDAKLWPPIQAKAITTQNVRQSLDYVARGEVDAGFVYETDAAWMKDKVKVAFVVPLKDKVVYPIAPIISSKQGPEAQRFVSFVLSAEGQAILNKHGFLKP